MPKKTKNKVANRVKKANSRPSAKKRPRRGSGGHGATDRKMLAWMMNGLSARDIPGNSVENAIGPLSTLRLKTRQDVLNLQAGYLAVHERLSQWTEASDRVDLSRRSFLSDEGKPYVMLAGRIADVRYEDDWDDGSPVKSICLMSPHAVDTETAEREMVDSHLWLKMSDLDPNAEMGSMTAHIGEMMVLVGELSTYESKVKGKDKLRLGVGAWCPMYIYFDAIVCGDPTILKRRELLSCKVFEIAVANGQCEVHRARMNELKPMMASLKATEVYRSGVKASAAPPISLAKAQAVANENCPFPSEPQ